MPKRPKGPLAWRFTGELTLEVSAQTMSPGRTATLHPHQKVSKRCSVDRLKIPTLGSCSTPASARRSVDLHTTQEKDFLSQKGLCVSSAQQALPPTLLNCIMLTCTRQDCRLQPESRRSGRCFVPSRPQWLSEGTTCPAGSKPTSTMILFYIA